jgi:hypothetical protein
MPSEIPGPDDVRHMLAVFDRLLMLIRRALPAGDMPEGLFDEDHWAFMSSVLDRLDGDQRREAMELLHELAQMRRRMGLDG